MQILRPRLVSRSGQVHLKLELQMGTCEMGARDMESC